MAAILIAAMSASAIFNVIFIRDQLITDSRHYAMHLSEVAEAGLENAMIIKEPEKIKSIMHSIGSRADIVGAAIFNKRGEIKYSIKPDDVGRTFSKNDSICIVCHGGTLTDQTKTIILPAKQGARILKVVRPIINKPKCQGCHQERVQGMLMVDLSLAEVDQQATALLGQQLRQSLATVVIVIIALIGFIYLIVTRPLAHFVRITRAIDNGDLDKRVSLTRKDEIGELGASFDRMVESMAVRTQDLERQNKIAAKEITERKKAEEALHSHQIELKMQNEELQRAHQELDVSHARYFDRYELAPVGYFTLGEKGLIQEANLTAANLLGLNRNAIIKQPITSFMLPEDQDIHYRHRKVLVETEKPQECELRMLRHGADPFWVLMRMTMSLYGDGSLMFRTVISDITERKLAEASLRESEITATRLSQENELIAEIGRIISSTLNIEEVFERFAEKAHKLIEFDRVTATIINQDEGTFTNSYVSGTEVVEHREGAVSPLSGSTAELVLQSRSGLIIQADTEKEVTELYPDFSNILRGGSQSKMSVPLISKGDVIGMLHFRSLKTNAYTTNDLAVAGTIANQIAGAIDNAQLFADRNRLDQQRRDIEDKLKRSEKMESLGKLAGGVAHDLNNVLGIMSGYSELLVELLPEESPLKDYAVNILKSTEKGAAIIQDLLTLARRGVVVSDVIDLNSVISTLLNAPEITSLKNYHTNVTFKTDLGKDLFNINGSPVHLEKTVMNLISNAAESIVGGGEVSLRTENRYVDKAIQRYDTVSEGDYVVLTVSDTGGGIAAADLDKIFEPFYTKKSMGRSGTGLGLAIVWGTVKDHNGYIDVQSDGGKGTTFALYFPATRANIDANIQEIPVEQYMGHGETVLIVDDVKGQRDVATALLIRLGYQVNSAASGEEAMEYLKNNNADILILDMIMEPGVDGLETYQQIISFKPKQKAIIVSGFSETERVDMAKLLGAGAYVKKPYVLEKIGVAIRDELARK